MARFTLELPENLIKDFQTLTDNTEKMMEEMTETGARVVYNNVKSSVPASWHSSKIMKCLKVTKTYRTPTDGGINTKVGFYGYFINKDGRKTPAPLVANVTEYGKHGKAKHPFFRKSFKKAQIENAMMEVQKRYIKEG